METGQGDTANPGLEDELRNIQPKLKAMKQLFRKRRATRAFPGEPQAQPIYRVGALVFQPDNTNKIIMGQPQGRDPDSRMCVGSSSALTRWKNVSTEKVLIARRKKQSSLFEAIERRPGYGSGQGRQGIARHVPSCPAALHLDCLDLRHDAPLRNCFKQNCSTGTNMN